MTTLPPTARYARTESARVAGLLLIVRRDGLPLGAPPGLRRYVRPSTAEAPSAFLANIMRDVARRDEWEVRRVRNGSAPDDGGPVPTHQQIKAWREAAGLTQYALATLARLSRGAVAQAEHPTEEKRAGPATTRHLATVLGHGDPAEWAGGVAPAGVPVP